MASRVSLLGAGTLAKATVASGNVSVRERLGTGENPRYAVGTIVFLPVATIVSTGKVNPDVPWKSANRRD